MNMKAKDLTPNDIDCKVVLHQGESRIVGRLTEIKAEAGDSWRMADRIVRSPANLALTIAGLELRVDLESEVEVLAA